MYIPSPRSNHILKSILIVLYQNNNKDDNIKNLYNLNVLKLLQILNYHQKQLLNYNKVFMKLNKRTKPNSKGLVLLKIHL